jgi:hypothetical protein
LTSHRIPSRGAGEGHLYGAHAQRALEPRERGGEKPIQRNFFENTTVLPGDFLFFQ